jgi:hypothetical protein
MRGKQEAKLDIWPNISDVKRHNPIVSVGDVKRLCQHTSGLKMDIVRRVRVLEQPFHA